ncbi:penicillin-binding transpeptidase domain-containing protein [Bengtsoniella intestinalis]|uniref:penicillin-binding transpeptidase domain-containing protein n=1 Tax=Bengtsoniella intestinalis TaxID=3073143 RepID=UPI00391FC4FA
MALSPKRKSEEARRANRVINHRTMWLMGILGVATFVALFIQLYDLQITQHEDLQEQAVAQQTASTTVTAARGSIFDRNGNVLAVSATAETVFVSPAEIEEYSETQDKYYIARGLARILEDVTEDTILEKMEKTYSQYEVIALRADASVSNQVRQFINGEIDEYGNEVAEGSQSRIRGVYLLEDSKRYYPYSSLASHIVGFVGTENTGLYGLESAYDSLLQGTTGLTVTAKNASGTDLLYQYEQYYQAQDGYSLALTIDANIQYYVETGIASIIEQFDAANGATGLVMDVNTGAVLAMASSPGYDLNNYSTIYDSGLAEAVAQYEEGSDEYWDALASAQLQQWRSKILNDTYEPGSTFKPITLAAAIEENKVSLNSTFTCNGYVMVDGWSSPIYCSNKYGHGTQTLIEATGNSCNPAFISMGLSLGTSTYYDYLESFGFTEKTGIDIIGETTGILLDEKSFGQNVVSLASYSFGQTFTVTPLQLVSALSATVNGGYLYTPYLVDQILDSDGNVIEQHNSTPVRQVVSEETSAIVRQCLEYVVAYGSGKNGQVAGYSIGGKTGTADKTGDPDGNVIVSFVCFAPADDPQVLMLMTLDSPSRDTGTYVSGGQMVAPTAGNVMGEILAYLGVEPDYDALEGAVADATVPNVVGYSQEEAISHLEAAGFGYTLVGDQPFVTDQTPVGGAIVPGDAAIVLYMGEEKSTELCSVPNVVGLTASQANTKITNAGLILKVTGTTDTTSGNVYAINQSLASDTLVAAGTVITVQFGDTSVID